MVNSGARGEAPEAEAVGREFLDRFARLLDRVRQEIAVAPASGQWAWLQAQALLDRLLFLYFVQKKGLLDADPDYFYRRFREGHAGWPADTSFYRQVVYPLLRATSDREANRSLTGSVGAVPYLGGGFLDRPPAPDGLPVTNATFQALFDELLERYDWTLGEAGIGPWILGHVFERLVLARGHGPGTGRRRATGSYYTPRFVVTFLVREALVEILAGGSGLERQDIARLLELSPADRLNDGQRAWLCATFSPGGAAELKRLLLDLRACDPAVGAGAFLVGLLRAMARTVRLLDWRLSGDVVLRRRNHAYDLKKQIVARCLYGVELQAQAVQICKLRLWLELLADYQLPPGAAFARAVQQVPSLDDLACWVRQGDSLLERSKGTGADGAGAAFAWRQDFAAVFEEKGGFDLIIGNPPYGARVPKGDWARIKARYAGAGSARNLAAAFLVLPFHYLHRDGIACQIVPKSVSYSRGWRHTRQVLWDRGCLLASADASQAFQGVLLEQEVVLYGISGGSQERPRSWHLQDGRFVPGHRLPLAMLKCQDAILNHLSAGAAGLLEQLLARGRPLGSYARTVRGPGWQSRLVAEDDARVSVGVIRGRDVRQFAVDEDLPRLLCDPPMEEKLRAMGGPKIVSQNIVAHVTRPYDTLLIVSALDRRGAAVLDTVNMTMPRPGCPYPLEYLLALLNSSLARWYFYFAVYNRAVRTVHLDAPYVDRFPVAPASPEEVARVCRLVVELEGKQARGETKYLLYGDDATYDALDEAIFALYALGPRDVDLVLRRGYGSLLATEER